MNKQQLKLKSNKQQTQINEKEATNNEAEAIDKKINLLFLLTFS